MSRVTEKLRFRVAAGTVSALALLAGTGLVASASASHTVECGDEISSDTTLTADVGPCNDGDGLVVTGDATLDLNGHRVYSNADRPRNDGTEFSEEEQIDLYIPADVVGVRLDGAEGATVKNGTVAGFAAGVSIEEGGSNTVQNVSARNNQAPCIGEDFSTQAVGDYGDGIVIFASSDNRIVNNEVENNGPFSGISVVANTGEGGNITKAVPPLPTGNLIYGNRVDDNDLCFGEIGIRIEGPGATENGVANNTVTDSYLEGVAVLATNTIDFSGIFEDPPTCQNRGFPDRSLPQCPLQDPLNPTNDDNVIRGNKVARNGFGGAQIPAGPGEEGANAPSPQSRAGIQLLSFCGYGVENGEGNRIRENKARVNAGNGVAVGGCDAHRPEGTFPGFTDSTVVDNISADNNRAGCGQLPSRPGCGTRPNTPRFDLLDTSNVINCPSTTAAIQERCANHGFNSPPPSPTPFLGRPVVDSGPACDSNTWSGNRYRTAFPRCTTAGGQVIASSAKASEPQPQKQAAADGARGDVSSAQSTPPPLRGAPAGLSR